MRVLSFGECIQPVESSGLRLPKPERCFRREVLSRSFQSNQDYGICVGSCTGIVFGANYREMVGSESFGKWWYWCSGGRVVRQWSLAVAMVWS